MSVILSNSVAQTLDPGQSATFDTIVLKTGNAECFRPNTGAVRLRFKSAMYEIKFGGNIGATAEGAAQIAIGFEGSPMLETTMISQTAAAGDLNSVSRETAVQTCCCDGGAVTIINTGTTSINLGAHPLLYIRRVA